MQNPFTNLELYQIFQLAHLRLNDDNAAKFATDPTFDTLRTKLTAWIADDVPFPVRLDPGCQVQVSDDVIESTRKAFWDIGFDASKIGPTVMAGIAVCVNHLDASRYYTTLGELGIELGVPERKVEPLTKPCCRCTRVSEFQAGDGKRYCTYHGHRLQAALNKQALIALREQDPKANPVALRIFEKRKELGVEDQYPYWSGKVIQSHAKEMSQ